MTTEKAVRATIMLGDIELNVFRMPDGEYRMSLTDAFLAVEPGYDASQAAKRNIEIQRTKKAKSIVPQGFQNIEKISYDSETTTSKVRAMCLTDVGSFWAVCAALKMEGAFPLVAACSVEALERRADKAFGIQCSEEERNDRMEICVEAFFSG